MIDGTTCRATRAAAGRAAVMPGPQRLPDAGPRSNQVHDREQDDPHQVDEVPVQPGQFERGVMRLRVGIEEKRPDEDDRSAGSRRR